MFSLHTKISTVICVNDKSDPYTGNVNINIKDRYARLMILLAVCIDFSIRVGDNIVKVHVRWPPFVPGYFTGIIQSVQHNSSVVGRILFYAGTSS